MKYYMQIFIYIVLIVNTINNFNFFNLKIFKKQYLSTYDI